MSCGVVARPEQTRLALNIYIDMNNLALRTPSSDLRGNQVLRWTLRDIKAAMGILTNWSRTRGSKLASPSHHLRELTAAVTEDAVAAPSPWKLRDDTLRKLFAAGDLQALIDQWGSSSLEELEAFVDAHFEMVWERAMSSALDDDVTERGGATQEEGAEQNAGSSVAKGLSMLPLLEDIQRDMTELKQSLDKCCKVMQELLEAHRGGQRPAEEDSHQAIHD